MAYHNIIYLLLFLPLALIVYQVVPRKARWAVLLLFGYIFFWSISGKLLIFLIGTTLVTHYTGKWIELTKQKCNAKVAELSKEDSHGVAKVYKKKEKMILAGGIFILLSVLAYMKYHNFFVENTNFLLKGLGSSFVFTKRYFAVPIGISFYTLQAVGYITDVYWGRIKGDCFLGKTALFLGFFPQIMEGPIALYSQTADALWEGNPIKAKNLSEGSLRILWGLFKKMVIADRLNLPVQEIFEHYGSYNGLIIAFGAVAYTIQLYMEFSGCMDIVIGSSNMFGVCLPENFRQPFASRNAAEFWRRWHITLGVWFKTYVFYPLSASAVVKRWNKFGRAHFGKYVTNLGVSAFCLFPVWLLNGLWHGPRWSYVFYGMYYFVILLLEIAIQPMTDRALKILHINRECAPYRIFKILGTWLIIFTGELFFRASDLSAGLSMFKSIFDGFEIQSLWDDTLLGIGLDKADYLAVTAGCVVVAIVGIVKERKLLGDAGIDKLCLPLRWGIYYGLILSVLILGAYGAGYQQVDLIYADF